MEPVISFGDWVRRRRKALDPTRQELANRVGCSLGALQKIERDERRPSRPLAGLLADHLHGPADHFPIQPHGNAAALTNVARVAEMSHVE